MSDSFIEALLSDKTDRIPDEYDWFAPLIGDWDCDYYDEPSEGHKRHVKGEKIAMKTGTHTQVPVPMTNVPMTRAILQGASLWWVMSRQRLFVGIVSERQEGVGLQPVAPARVLGEVRELVGFAETVAP